MYTLRRRACRDGTLGVEKMAEMENKSTGALHLEQCLVFACNLLQRDLSSSIYLSAVVLRLIVC